MMVIKGGKCKEERNRKKRKHEQVTTSNMVLKSLLRPARYFHGSIMTNRCFNPNKPRRRPCLICASFHHVTKKHHCSMNKDCSDKTTTSSVCLRCGGLGHDMGLCKYEYTEDDLKSVQCYVCKRFGHLCCGEACDSLWDVSCYRCGQLGHTGLSCGRHFEGDPEIESGFAASAANQDDLEKEKKKKQRLDGEGVADSTPHESNRTMMKKKKNKRKKKKNNKNSEQHVTAHESKGEKNDGILEQHSTLPEFNRKTKKNNVELKPTHESNRKRKKNKKAKDEKTLIAEKPNLRSGWITEDLEENPFHRGNIRRLSSPTAASGQDHHILPVSPPGHNHRLHAAHMGHYYGSPRFISGGHYYPDSHSTTPYDRNRTDSSFEYNGHLSDPPPSRLWEHNYPPTSPIAPLGHSHHRLPFTPPGHGHRSSTFSSGGPYTGSLSTLPSSGNRRYSSFESNRHPLDLPSSRLRERYYPPTSPIASSGHDHHLLPVTPQGHNHRLPTFSSGEHLSTIPLHGENHRDSFFEYNGRHLDPPFSRWQPHYHPTSPITPAGHNHHMLPSTYMDRNHMLHSTYEGHSQRSPTFNSGGHYSSPLSSTRYGGYHKNSPFESNGHLSGPSTSRWHSYYPPTSSHHHHQEQNIYDHAPSRYGPPHRYGEFSGNYERW
ncbi:hypothetical protein HA466_0290790 [Hirschfeldia incana]|nr:hypothetical protein HA466_0290790 [Hirschfeldia incana]